MALTENVSARDFYLEVAKGKIQQHTYVNKFGENHDIDTGTTPEDIWSAGGVYVPPTANRIHQIKSSSANDAGTLIGTYTSTTYSETQLIDSGATFITDGVSVGDVVVDDTSQDHTLVISIDSETQLTIENWHHNGSSNLGNVFRIATAASTGAVFTHVRLGQQKDGTSLTEFVLLNGVTNVPTVNTYFRMSRMHIHGVGTNKTNVGNITATADTDATVTAYIEAGHSQTLIAFVHVPQGKTAYMTSYYASMYRGTKIADAMAQMQLMSNLWGADVETVEHAFSLGAASGSFVKEFKPPKKFTQGTDIWMRCIEVTDSDSEISAGFDIVMVDN